MELLIGLVFAPKRPFALMEVWFFGSSAQGGKHSMHDIDILSTRDRGREGIALGNYVAR